MEIAGGWWEIRTVGWVYPGNDLNLSVSYPDAWLRPIRDPGDDARDETLNWLPVPTKEIA